MKDAIRWFSKKSSANFAFQTLAVVLRIEFAEVAFREFNRLTFVIDSAGKLTIFYAEG